MNARSRNATDVKVEGNDAWITVTTASTDGSSVMECSTLLGATTPDSGETITVIYTDGVEELCQWPDEVSAD